MSKYFILPAMAVFIGGTLARDHLIGPHPLVALLLFYPFIPFAVDMLLIRRKKDNAQSWGMLQYLLYLISAGCILLTLVFAGYIPLLGYLLISYVLLGITSRRANPPWVRPNV